MVSPQIQALLAFWGKAQSRSEEGPRYHPLPCHALDVAAVGKVWLELDGHLRVWLGRLMGIPADHVAPLICPLLALHDIGKFAAYFQIKAPAVFPSAVFGEVPEPRVSFHHDTLGFHFLIDRFIDNFPFWRKDDLYALVPLLKAVTGHHGEPPSDQVTPRALLNDYWSAGLAAAQSFCHLVIDLIGQPLTLPDERAAMRASTVIAGFAIACDWLGSNQRHFPYNEPQIDLAEYWIVAQQRAHQALLAAGVISARPAAPVSLADLLDNVVGAQPSASQEWAATVSLPEGPLLVLLEDETGSGKTEAALILASRLMARGDATGIYTALPTMATANALFDRLARCYRRLFEEGSSPSLALIHGRSELRETFRSLHLGDMEEAERYGDEDSASTLCAQWLLDDRRKAFLADVGVGTIDQAVLSILPVRFQALRVFGLARKVLILDEVHAYDAFVSQELQRLIEWQATAGGSCILLSATLPIEVRRRLIRAFRGAVRCPEVDVAETGYPLATLVSADGCQLTTAENRSGRARSLPVRLLHDPEDALEFASEQAAQGRAAAYIRNTVDDAIEAYTRLRERGFDALLFHARMALIDRFRVEGEVLRLFGKGSDAQNRSGKVVIATQVIEQSLDLDFDSLITDLAPIDLIVQRAGRLWRHARSERTGSPELLVLAPDPVTGADANWYGRLLPHAQWVYRDHARLWLTADILKQRLTIDSPRGIRSLIEQVYGDGEDRIPKALLPSRMQAEGKSSAQRGEANRQILDPRSGYTHIGAWEDDARPRTRLDERPQVTLRLTVWLGDRLLPYASACSNAAQLGEAEQWTLSEVQVSARRALAENNPAELVSKVAACKATWGRFDQSKLLVILSKEAGSETFHGSVSEADGKSSQVTYSAKCGLAFATPRADQPKRAGQIG